MNMKNLILNIIKKINPKWYVKLCIRWEMPF